MLECKIGCLGPQSKLYCQKICFEIFCEPGIKYSLNVKSCNIYECIGFCKKKRNLVRLEWDYSILLFTYEKLMQV